MTKPNVDSIDQWVRRWKLTLITAILLGDLATAASAQEVLLKEDFNTDGAGTRYAVEGGLVSEQSDHANNSVSVDQTGPVFWARNTEVSIVGVPGPTPARRAILAWDPAITEDQISEDFYKLFDATIKWLLKDKTSAKILLAPAGIAPSLAARLTKSGHTLIDDDSSVPADQMVADLIVRGNGAGDSSRFATSKIPMIAFTGTDADDLLISTIGSTQTFEAGNATIAAPAHPAAGGLTGSFPIATGSHAWETMGALFPIGATTLATMERLVPATAATLADVDGMASGAKQSTKATETFTALDFWDNSAGDWFSDFAPPGGVTGVYGLVAKGKITVSTAGTYSFAVGVDDGARLRIDKDSNGFTDADNVVVEDAAGAFRPRFGDVQLAAGTFDFEVTWFNSGGDGGLEVSVSTKAGGGDTSAITSGTWELLGTTTGAVKLQGTISATSHVPSGPPETQNIPLIVLINGPDEGGSVFGGGPFGEFEGSGYFAGAGLNKFTGADGVATPKVVTLNPVNVAGKQNLKLSFLASATFLDFESSDFLDFKVGEAGGDPAGFTTLVHFTAPSGSDKFFDNRSTQPGNTTQLGLAAKEVSVAIPSGINNLVVRVEAFTSWWNEIVAFDNIRVTSGEVAPPPSGGGDVTTIEVRVAGGLDDAEEHLTEANAIDITSTDLELGAEGGGGDTQAIGIRFRNINIPSGSTINRATIQFTVDEADDEPTSVLIFGQLSPNPTEFTTTAGDITARTKTVASVQWNNIPVWNSASIGSAGPDQLTPDLSAIVREVIAQPGWAANNAMAFIIMPNPGGERTAESFDGVPASAPLLQIEYIAASAPPPAAVGIPVAASLSAGTPRTTPGDGLFGQYWKRNAVSILTDGAANRANGIDKQIQGFGTPSGTFSATLLNYTGNDLTQVGAWLAGDGASFAGTPDNLDDGAFRFSGFINIAQAGVLNIGTTSDDGSRIAVGGIDIINNDGSHGDATVDGDVNFAAAGVYPIEITFFNGDWTSDGANNHSGSTDPSVHGGANFHLRIAGANATPTDVGKYFYTTPEPNFVHAGLAVNNPLTTPGDGLKGEYWKRDPVSILTDGASNRANGIDQQLKGFGAPSGTFTATTLNYTGNDLTDVVAWLGADGSSFSGTPANLDDGAFRFSGFINVAAAGKLNIGTTSDDGSRIKIGGVDLVNNDSSHGDATVDTSVNFAAAGVYPIEITYFNGDWTSDGADNHSGSTDPSVHGGANFHLRVGGANVTADGAKMFFTTPDGLPAGPPALKALLVVGTASVPNLNAADTGLKAHLESLGFEVTAIAAPSSTTGDADGMALIITSSTVNSGDVGDKFRDVKIPVVNWEQALQDNYLMTGNAGTDHATTSADQTTLEIVNSNHPLAAGLAEGVVTVATSPQPWSWGLPTAGAVTIAHVTGNPAQVVIYGYETGASMFNGTSAPARRVMLFGGDDTFANLTPEGLALYDAGLRWAAGLPAAGAGGPAFTAITFSGGKLTIEWSGGGTLESAADITGPWTAVAGASSPYTAQASAVAGFFRVRQ